MNFLHFIVMSILLILALLLYITALLMICKWCLPPYEIPQPNSSPNKGNLATSKLIK